MESPTVCLGSFLRASSLPPHHGLVRGKDALRCAPPECSQRTCPPGYTAHLVVALPGLQSPTLMHLLWSCPIPSDCSALGSLLQPPAFEQGSSFVVCWLTPWALDGITLLGLAPWYLRPLVFALPTLTSPSTANIWGDRADRGFCSPSLFFNGSGSFRGSWGGRQRQVFVGQAGLTLSELFSQGLWVAVQPYPLTLSQDHPQQQS